MRGWIGCRVVRLHTVGVHVRWMSAGNASTAQQYVYGNKPTWKELGVPSWLCAKLEKLRYSPTDIQISALKAMGKDYASKPQHLRDYVLHDLTGTGKSLAYLLPVLLAVDNYQPHLQAVIVAPTRELATQIGLLAAKLTSQPGKYRKRSPLVVKMLVGHLNPRMIESLRSETPHILIGTPGLLHQLLVEKHYHKYHQLSTDKGIVNTISQPVASICHQKSSNRSPF